jgi:hypothetical protein
MTTWIWYGDSSCCGSKFHDLSPNGWFRDCNLCAKVLGFDLASDMEYSIEEYRGFPTLLRGNSHSHELLTFGFYASTCLPIGSLVVCDIAVMLAKPCLHIHQLWFPLNVPYIYTYIIRIISHYIMYIYIYYIYRDIYGIPWLYIYIHISYCSIYEICTHCNMYPFNLSGLLHKLRPLCFGPCWCLSSPTRLDGSRPGRRYWTMWCLLFAR